MSHYVFDASAFLAIVRKERGADLAASRLPGSSMSTINASEALMRGAEKGCSFELMRLLLANEGVSLVEFDEALAVSTALLRPATRAFGLSFADRACIATAVRLSAAIVTADRVWAELDLPCKVELIR